MDPEDVALRALGRLIADPDRLGRFLAVTGLSPDTIRTAARSPGFLTGVVDYVLSDEDLLLEVAREAELDPSDFALARARLSPEAEEG